LQENETVPKSEFKKVLIHGDGRCFFRCISVHLVDKLRKCTRSPLGISEFECMEIVLADQIRKEAVSLLKHHEPVLSTLSSSLQFYLDKEMGHQYTTLSERLMCMERTTEFADFLEILAVAYLLQMKICIYQETSDRKHYQLRAVLPATRFDKKPAIHLLHHSDTNKKPGHYELIISNTTDADSQQSKEFQCGIPTTPQHFATISQHIPTIPQHFATTSQHTPTASQHIPTTSQHIPTAPQHFATTPQPE
jgi:hypothetical protein